MSEKMGEKKKGKKTADLMERLVAMEARVEEAERRLDKHAKLITGWRERVKALEQQECCAGQGGGAGTAGDGAVSEVSDPGWMMKPECLICGAGKEPGREKRLTCEDCGKRYYEQSRRGYEGERPQYSRCLSCGSERKSPGPALQCAKCSAAFKEWKTRA